MAENTKSNKKQTSDEMSVKDWFLLCVARWKWFVLSLGICVGAAVLYILKTPAQYTRTAELLIKEDSKGRRSSLASELSSFADMGMFSANTNINNEVKSIQSPAVVLEVVKRLDLQMDYLVEGAFTKLTLYGSDLPIKASVADLPDNAFCSWKLDLGNDGKVSLYGFSLNGNKIEDEKVYGGIFDKPIATPVGDIVITPTPNYIKGGEYGTIHVSRSGAVSSIERCLKRFSAELDKQKINQSTIISLTYQDVSIQRAEDFLNTIISVYNENWVKDKNQIAVSTSEFINERLKVIEKELGNVDNDISSYKSEHQIPDVNAAANLYMDKANKANERALDLNNELYMARYIRNFVTTDANKFQLLPANSGIKNSIIEKQITDYNASLLQRNSLVANSSVKNPMVVDLDKALSSMRSSIISSIDNQINALSKQISTYRSEEAVNTSRITSNPTQAKYLISVERQQKVKEALYLFLLQKREENELSQAFTAYNTRVITPPYGNFRPTSPQKSKILLVAFAVGLLLPIVIIYMIDSMNTKVRGRKDLEGITIPFIGEIPMYIPRKKGLFRRKNKENDKTLVKRGSRDIINEAFRVLRTNLEFITESSEKTNVIALTSFNPGSGKSFLSMNIAACLAIKDKKVLVIDGDLRHASTSAYVDSPSVGISDILNGRVNDYSEAIVTSPNYENLDVLPVGTIPPNPTELLFSPRLKEVVEQARTKYDYVFVDCPPFEIVADTQIIEKYVDRTIFVVRAGVLERNMLPELENIYNEKKFKNMALVLNGTYRGSSRYGYRYGYGYGYGYGYHYGSDDKHSKKK